MIGETLDRFARRDWEQDTVEPLAVAVVGVGSFARRRAIPAIDAAEFCRLGALVTASPEATRSVAEEHGARLISRTAFHAGEGEESYDAVYVCTPNALHLPYVETAAEQGKAVLCEKPLEANTGRAERLVAACEDAGVPLMTAYRMQADPTLRRVRDLVRGGAVGDPVKVHGGFSVDLSGAGGWRFDRDTAGGGALMDLGVYPLNAARFVLDSDPGAVWGTTATPSDGFGDVEEHVSFCATFGAATGLFTASFRAHIEDRFQVLGTDGQVEVGNAFYSEAARTVRVEHGGRTWEVESPGVNEISEEFDYFAHAVRTGADIEPDGADGLADLRAIEGVYDAAQSGAAVSL